MVRRQASKASGRKVNAATAMPKPTMNTAPRAEAISGRDDSVRHSGQLASTAIHSDASSATVSGLWAGRSEDAGNEVERGRGMRLLSLLARPRRPKGFAQLRRLRPPAERPLCLLPIRCAPLLQ